MEASRAEPDVGMDWAQEFGRLIDGIRTTDVPQIFTLMGGLDSTRGGRTRAVIARQRALSGTFGTHLLTLIPQRNLYTEVETVRRNGLLPESTSVIPVVPAFLEVHRRRPHKPRGIGNTRLSEGLPTEWADLGESLRHQLRNLPVVDRWLPPVGSDTQIRVVQPGYRGITWLQTRDSSRVQKDGLVREATGQVLTIHRSKNVSYLSSSVRVALLSQDNPDEHLTFPELCSEVARFLMGRASTPLVVSDVIGTDPIVRMARTSQAIAILQFHGAGLGRLDTGDPFDAVVYPTNQQYQDSIGVNALPASRHKWIPHYLSPSAATPQVTGQGWNPVVAYLGRMDANKRVGHVIKAFAGVLKQAPTAKLRIYGKGPYQARLERMVSADPALSKAIEFMGYTSDPMSALASATVSVVTSKHEGFCLALFESLSVGTPVVSYAFRYGPKDVIVDGSNGYLVTDGDVAGLRDGIVRVLGCDADQAREMREAAKASVSQLEESRFLADWKELVDSVAPILPSKRGKDA